MVIINTELPSPDNQLVDLTKGICGQAQSLGSQIQKRLQLMGVSSSQQISNATASSTTAQSNLEGISSSQAAMHIVAASGFGGY